MSYATQLLLAILVLVAALGWLDRGVRLRAREPPRRRRA
jgi:hypothetical protein